MAVVGDIYNALDSFCPFEVHEPWDNVGLLVGEKETEVSRAAVVLDITPDAVERAHEAGAQLIVIDGATLIESGCSKMCSVLISVTAEEETRLTRIIHRDGISKKDALRRVSAQHTEDFYTQNSDYVIKNNGTPGDLERETEKVIEEIEKGKEAFSAEDIS